jgi:NTE family protein
MALCLSGGGYRAMLFHTGALWRLNEAALLSDLKRISSVSGGSIVAGVLGAAWGELRFNASGVAEGFEDTVLRRVRELAGRSIDIRAAMAGTLWFGSAGNRLADAYDRHLFNGKTLQDLPNDPPRFVFNATSLQSGVLWRFSKPYMADYRVGMVREPEVPLATAVAASSAFPPFLSPLRLDLRDMQVVAVKGVDMHEPPFTEEAVLTDGGVYDNLGLETAFKRYRTVLISNGGGYLAGAKRPWKNWFPQAVRVMKLIDNQVRSLRSRNAIDDFNGPVWSGTYWGIRTPIADYKARHKLHCDQKRADNLADEPTRLSKIDDERQERLINWGYAICDAALRSWVDKTLPPPGGFPYPNRPV